MVNENNLLFSDEVSKVAGLQKQSKFLITVYKGLVPEVQQELASRNYKVETTDVPGELLVEDVDADLVVALLLSQGYDIGKSEPYVKTADREPVGVDVDVIRKAPRFKGLPGRDPEEVTWRVKEDDPGEPSGMSEPVDSINQEATFQEGHDGADRQQDMGEINVSDKYDRPISYGAKVDMLPGNKVKLPDGRIVTLAGPFKGVNPRPDLVVGKEVKVYRTGHVGKIMDILNDPEGLYYLVDIPGGNVEGAFAGGLQGIKKAADETTTSEPPKSMEDSAKELEEHLRKPVDFNSLPDTDKAGILTLHFIGFIAKPLNVPDDVYKAAAEAFDSHRGKTEWEEEAVAKALTDLGIIKKAADKIMALGFNEDKVNLYVKEFSEQWSGVAEKYRFWQWMNLRYHDYDEKDGVEAFNRLKAMNKLAFVSTSAFVPYFPMGYDATCDDCGKDIPAKIECFLNEDNGKLICKDCYYVKYAIKKTALKVVQRMRYEEAGDWLMFVPSILQEALDSGLELVIEYIEDGVLTSDLSTNLQGQTVLIDGVEYRVGGGDVL